MFHLLIPGLVAANMAVKFLYVSLKTSSGFTHANVMSLKWSLAWQPPYMKLWS